MKITTREQLEAHIKSHKGNDVPLFSAYGEFGIVGNETLKSHQKIEIKINKTTNSPFVYLDNFARYSLRDRHLYEENSYNDNWWFTTEEEAKAYAGVTE